MAKDETRPRGRRASRSADEPRQGDTSPHDGRGDHEARPRRVLPDGRRRRAARHLRERPTVLKRWDGHRRATSSSRSACRRARRSGCRRRPSLPRPAAARRSSSPVDAAHLVVGGQPRRDRLQPVAGAARRPRPPRRAARRPRPDARGVGWDDVRQVALMVREVLDEHGLRGFPKTSGSRGIHVYVRLEPELGLHRGPPRRARAGARGRARGCRELATSASGGRRSATACSSTTTRTRATARSPPPTRCGPCPTPASRCRSSWDEVPDVEPADFRLDTVPERLREQRRPARPTSTTSRRPLDAPARPGPRATRRRASATRPGRRTSASSRASPSACSRAAARPPEEGQAQARPRRRSPAPGPRRQASRAPAPPLRPQAEGAPHRPGPAGGVRRLAAASCAGGREGPGRVNGGIEGGLAVGSGPARRECEVAHDMDGELNARRPSPVRATLDARRSAALHNDAATA